MYLTLVCLIVSVSVSVFFSKELSGYVKKIKKIPGASLVISLLLGSYFVQTQATESAHILRGYQIAMQNLFLHLDHVFSLNSTDKLFLHAAYLFLLSSLPFWIMQAFPASRSFSNHPSKAVMLGGVVWIISAVLLVAGL